MKKGKLRFKKLLTLLLVLANAIVIYMVIRNPVSLSVVRWGLGTVMQMVMSLGFMVVQFGGLFWFMSRSKIEIIKPEDAKSVTFDDYWGQPTLKALVKQWLVLLADRKTFVEMGGEYINGLLLFGEPGTGKTMLAKAMAGESGVAFISIEGSGFRAMFWGVDVMKMIWFVRKARKLARKYGACIAYIDEIDAVGQSRGGVMGKDSAGVPGGGGGGAGLFGGTGALTRLLYEMDGVGEKTRGEKIKGRILKLFKKKPKARNWHLLFAGSTNRPDVLDPALTRPGRFDQSIKVSLPDQAGRREIIQGYLSKIKSAADVDVETLVRNTAGTTPAQIMSALTKDSVRIALFDQRRQVTQRDVEAALIQQRVGIENPIKEMDPQQRQQIAVHEAGHAIVQHYLLPDQKIAHLTIVARGRALGFMLPLDEIEIFAQPLSRIVGNVKVALAGHIATEVVFDEPWTGAAGDFEQAKRHIRHLYALGYFGNPVAALFENKDHFQQIESYWTKTCLAVKTILQEHKDELVALADTLLEKESMNTREVMEVLA